MPLPSPFHPRTEKLCESKRWKDWAGYFAVSSYDTTQDREYFAIRHSAAAIDVSPLFKYDIQGKDAGAFLAYVCVKDVSKMKDSQVTYLCWCDDQGYVLDDGTVTRFRQDFYRLTAAEPTYAWLMKLSRGFDVKITDRTAELAVLSLQGPNSRALLSQVTDADLSKLGFFKSANAKIGDKPGVISRTGYTGDLGYEIWVDTKDALPVWDAIFSHARTYGLEACGLDAMDVSRVEAGFIMNGVDYYSSNRVSVNSRKSTPAAIGLGKAVQLKRESPENSRFVGQKALLEEAKNGGPEKQIVCLEIDWNELEALFNQRDLPPEVPTAAWRTFYPIYDQNGVQVGKATSGAFSPTLKKNLAFAHVKSEHAALGSKLKFETNVDFERKLITATVIPSPAFNPARKRSL